MDEPRLNQPKVPNSTKDWAAMDIFVFSNGQQYSPPRKYHLRAEELNWWQATLGYIARSQYGAMYSTIELYSIDGHKITSPVELRDGSAYVAVVPPDAFINAGYEKYIIKASKSSEKRQSKLRSATKESTNSGQSKSKVGIEIPEEKNENSNQDVSQAGNLHKNTHQGRGQQGSKNNSATIILKPKRRPYSGSNRTSILRKLNNEFKTSPEVSKPTKRKEEPIKIKEPVKVISPLAGNLNDKSIKTGLEVKQNIKRPKTPQKKQQAPVQLATPKISENFTYEKLVTKKITEVTVPVNKIDTKGNDEIENGIDEKEIIVLSNPPEVNVPADKKESTDNSEIEYALEDKEIVVISNPPKKEDDDLLYMFWNLNDASQENKLPDYLTPNELTTIQAIKETQTPDFVVKSISRASSPIRKPSRNNSKTQTDQATQLEPMTNDEPFVTVTNNGDAFNIKLSIELNDSGGVVSNVQANIVGTQQCTEEVGQENQNTINIDEIIKKSKSLKSLSDCGCECSKKDNIVYVLQCTCDPQETPDINDKMYAKILGDNHTAKTYLIVIPIVTIVDKDSSRTRNKETSKQSAENQVQNDDEIVTVVNFMDSGQEMYNFPHSFPLSIEYKEISIHSVTNVDCYTMSLNSEIAGTSSESTDASTQTEWCSIVLEVRRHEDGRYTFHLPPLQILRTYYNKVL